MLSTAVEVTGTQSMDLANLLILGNLGTFTFHHSKICVLLLGGLSYKYISISSLMMMKKDPLASSGPNKISKADF